MHLFPWLFFSQKHEKSQYWLKRSLMTNGPYSEVDISNTLDDKFGQISKANSS